MSTDYEAVNRIITLKQGIESITGETYTDLTNAVQGLKDKGGNIKEFLEGNTSGEIDLSEFTYLRTGILSEFKNITRVIMPNNIKTIPNYSFYKCESLKDANIPYGVNEIGVQAFAFCSSFSDFFIPDTVEIIGVGAFWGCGITTLILTSVLSLGNSAFADCPSLTTVTFKSSPAEIPNQVFLGCDNLTTINVPWSIDSFCNANAPWGAVNATINYNYTGE